MSAIAKADWQGAAAALIQDHDPMAADILHGLGFT